MLCGEPCHLVSSYFYPATSLFSVMFLTPCIEGSSEQLICGPLLLANTDFTDLPHILISINSFFQTEEAQFSHPFF